MATKKRITSFILMLLIVLTLLPTQVYAGWTASAGGVGLASNDGKGSWRYFYQGIRITVIDDKGNPALMYGRNATRESMDFLYGLDGLHAVDYFYGGSKGLATYPNLPRYSAEFGYAPKDWNSVRVFAQKSLMQANTDISMFGWIRDTVDIGEWKVVTPASGVTINNLNGLQQFLPVETSGNGDTTNWRAMGDKFREMFYGPLDAGQPKDTAAIYQVFNIYYQDGTPVWNLTPAAKGNISADLAARHANGLNEPDATKLSTVKLMQECGFAIVIEPIMWAELRGLYGKATNIVLYGTATNIAAAINSLVASGEFIHPNYQTGGYDKINYSANRHSFVLTSNVEYAGKTFVAPPSDQVGKIEGHKPTNDEVHNANFTNNGATGISGWGMHIYICGSNPETHTWDNVNYPGMPNYKEAPAPDPRTDPATRDKVKGKDDILHYNIVKVYETETINPDGTKTINHVTTQLRHETLPKIKIEDEVEPGGYKVIEWKYSPDSPKDILETTITDKTKWDDPPIANVQVVEKNPTPIVIPHTVEIQDKEDPAKEMTLYVRLRKPDEIPKTQTWDDINFPGPEPTPGPAPDPTEYPPPVDPDNKYLHFNIVKVYEEDTDDDGVYEYVTTTIRQSTAPIIKIMSEGNGKLMWKLKEWKFSADPYEDCSNTDWPQPPISTVNAIQSGTSETTVNIMNPDDIEEERTLYVLLQRKIPPQPDPTGLVIRESQLSKSIHTNDGNIDGSEYWGNYQFDIQIGPFSPTHTYKIDHGCCRKRWGTDSDGDRYIIHDCGKCHGHPCTLAMPGIDGDQKLNLRVFI